jgi:hypothetical protein
LELRGVSAQVQQEGDVKGQTPSDKGGYIEKMLFFFTDDAFMQHREAKRMLLDVSRPVVLMG